MNKLDHADRARILHLLCEGNSLRAVTRLTGASKKAVNKLMLDAGQAAAWYQDHVFRNLSCKRVQVDEIWSFTYAKQANVPTAKAAPQQAGDTWTWTALDADTKLLISWFVGDRSTETAVCFLDEVRNRLAGRFQLTSDGYRPYLEAVATVFGDEIDYSQLVKLYGPSLEGERRYSPPVCVGARKHKVVGNPDPKHVSTSYAERHNLTMRMHMRRFTRLTNAFSKKIENHGYAVALYSMHYNFVRVHKTLKVSPAMAASVSDRLWEISDLVAMLESWEAKEKRDAQPIFEILEWKIGGGFYVKATLPNSEPENISGFKTKNDAIRWVRNDSKAWLHQRARLSRALA